MSGYNGRRAPNVSQYVANLNTIPSAYEMAMQNQDTFNLDDSLSSFLDMDQYIDFDIGDIPDLQQPVEYDPAQHERVRRQNASAYKNNENSLDFLDSDFQLPDFSAYPNGLPDPSTAGLQPVPPTQYPLPQLTSPAPTSPVAALPLPHAGEKRKIDVISHPITAHPAAADDTSRLLAEEDKRRRNTAASARFRVKKKQREQALEKTAKEMTEKVSVLETRVQQLEMENKWLKSLITEKNGNKEDIAEMYKKFTKDGTDERSTGERTDGVGTDDVQAE